MRRIVLIGAVLALAGCSATGPKEAPGAASSSTLSGKDIQMAVSLYGPWNEQVTLDGVPTYIWRRHYTAGDTKQEFYCELRVQMGFRHTISGSQMQGYPAACNLFGIKYTSAMK